MTYCVHCGDRLAYPSDADAVFGPGNAACIPCARANGHDHAEDDPSIEVSADECLICAYVGSDR